MPADPAYYQWLASAQSADEPLPFTLHTPTTVADALTGISHGDGAAMGGGTELLLELRRRTRTPRAVVSLAGLAELQSVQHRGGRLRVGAAVPLASVAASAVVAQAAPALAAAAGSVGTPQIRAQGTVGGNLLQLPRCLYLWRGMPCMRTGGTGCPAAHAGMGVAVPLSGPVATRCLAAQGSDVAAALVLLDGQIEIAATAGRRDCPASAFFTEIPAAGLGGTRLAPGELVVGFTVPSSHWAVSGYVKGNFPNGSALDTLGVAVALTVKDDRCAQARAVVAGATGVPWPVPGFDGGLRGARLRDAAGRVDTLVRASARRFTARHGLLCELLERVLGQLAQECQPTRALPDEPGYHH